MGISNAFNVEDLTLYQGHDNDKQNDTSTAILPAGPRLKETEDILTIK